MSTDPEAGPIAEFIIDCTEKPFDKTVPQAVSTEEREQAAYFETWLLNSSHDIVPPWDSIRTALPPYIKKLFLNEWNEADTPEEQSQIAEFFRPFLENGVRGHAHFCGVMSSHHIRTAENALQQIPNTAAEELPSLTQLVQQSLIVAHNFTDLLTNIAYVNIAPPQPRAKLT